MQTSQQILSLIDQAYDLTSWHGPNLKQSIRGVTASQAAWRPATGRHNIWEEALHAAYWKYVVRRKLEGGRRGSFALKGSNFFPRPEPGEHTEAAWRADKELLEREHRGLREAIVKTLQKNPSPAVLRLLYGISFHDIYHAGQIRLLRRLQSG
jgi:hypothetical protein